MTASIGFRNSVAVPTSPSTTSEVTFTEGKPVLSQSQQGDSNVRNGLGRPSALGSQQSLITSLESEVQGTQEEGDSDKDNEGGISSETNKKRKVDGVVQERKTSGKYSHGTKARIHLGVMVAGSIVGIALSVVCPPLGIAGVAFLNTGLLKLHGGKVFWLDTKSEKNKDEQPKKQPEESPENKPTQDTQTQPPKPADIPDDSHPKKDPEDNADDFPHVITSNGKNHTVNSFVNIKIDIPRRDPEQNDSSTNTDKGPEQEIATPEEIFTEHGRVTPQELLTVQEILKEYKEKVVHLVEEPQTDDDVFIAVPTREDVREAHLVEKPQTGDDAFIAVPTREDVREAHLVEKPQTDDDAFIAVPTREDVREAHLVEKPQTDDDAFIAVPTREDVREAHLVEKPQTDDDAFIAVPTREDVREAHLVEKPQTDDDVFIAVPTREDVREAHLVEKPQTGDDAFIAVPTREDVREAHLVEKPQTDDDVFIAVPTREDVREAYLVEKPQPDDDVALHDPELINGVDPRTALKMSNDSTLVRGDAPDTVKSWPTVEPARGVIGSGAHTGANYTGNNDHEKVRIANSPSDEAQTSQVVNPQTPQQAKAEDHSTTSKQAETDSPSATVLGKTTEQPTLVRGDAPDTVKSWPKVKPARGVIGSGAYTGANYTGNNDHEKVRIANSPSGEAQTSKVVKPQTPEQFFDAPEPEDGVEVKTARKITSNDSTSGPEHGNQVVVPQTGGNGSWPTVEPSRGVIGSGANTGASYTGNNVHDKVRVGSYKLPIETQRVLSQKDTNKKVYIEKNSNGETAIKSRDMGRQVKLPYFNSSNQLDYGDYKSYLQTLRKKKNYDELKEADNQQSEVPKLRIFGKNGFPWVDKNNFVQVSSQA